MSAFNPVIWPFRLVLCTAFALLALQALAKLIRAGRVLAGKPVPAQPSERGREP